MCSQKTQTVFITGGSSGIGLATVRLFAQKGWSVATTTRHPERFPDIPEKENITVIRLDLADPQSIEQAKQEAVEKLGEVSVLINNAGYGLMGPVEGCTIEQIRHQFEVNVLGVMHLVQLFLPEMRERESGTILSVTSIGGRMTFPYFGAYNAAKHALESFHEALWYELRRLPNIRIKVMEPGFTQTNFATKGMMMGKNDIPFYRESLQTLEKNLRTGQDGSDPEVIARALYAAAQDSSPKLRYHAGHLSTTLLTLRKILPDGLFRRMILRFITT